MPVMLLVIDLFTWVAVVAMSSRSIPQARKLLVSKEIAGVSTAAYALSAVDSLCWATWGTVEKVWIPVPGNALNVAVSSAVCAAAVKAGAPLRHAAFAGGAAITVAGVAVALSGSNGALAVAGVITLGFALVSVTKALRSESVAGLSKRTWQLQLLGAGMYVVWATAHVKLVSLTTAIVDVLCALLILRKIRQTPTPVQSVGCSAQRA